MSSVKSMSSLPLCGSIFILSFSIMRKHLACLGWRRPVCWECLGALGMGDLVCLAGGTVSVIPITVLTGNIQLLLQNLWMSTVPHFPLLVTPLGTENWGYESVYRISLGAVPQLESTTCLTTYLLKCSLFLLHLYLTGSLLLFFISPFQGEAQTDKSRW